MPLPPLPEVPGFPVYGLDDSFDGSRLLITWNSPDYLWTVTLGFGLPRTGSWIGVTTQRHPASDRRGRISEKPAVYFAAISAANHLADSAGLRGARLTALHHEEFERVQLQDDGAVHLDGREATRIRVSGHPVTAYIRRVHRTASLIIDLPPVAVTVSGDDELDPATVSLEVVTKRLDEYPPRE